MTLAQWAENWPYRVTHVNEFSAHTPDHMSVKPSTMRVDAFHLEDYLVSTVSGGTLWFYKRPVKEVQE